jgi:NADH-quinone oxidoreductase subunit L
MFFLRNAWLIPAIPGTCFWLILFFGKRMPGKGADIGIAGVGASFLLSLGAAYQWITMDTPRHAVESHVTWFKMGGIDVHAGTHIDGLAVMMLFVVTLVSLMVHVYSLGYMHGDRRFTFFYAALALFTASMLMLVVAPNTLQLMVGWELVGVCSFMLIGHWWEEEVNSAAAIKAFITTRTGDVGLMLGIIVLFFAAGRNFDIVHLNRLALTGGISHHLLLVGALLLLLGVVGKSAQFPLHVWLPDAMAGPTPVSALIHAATMVVAGVYLVARVYGVFLSGLSIGPAGNGVNALALIGGITVIIGAALAFVQDDVKRVLAYSTISQLGYMVMALGVGAWTAGIFHLFTHAFFKALLFLGSGALIHAVHSNNMSDMGGLRKYMPTTFWTFIVGSLALAGIFPLAGFWSKDEILLGASRGGYPIFLWVGVIGAFMTAAYMTRACYLVFWGEYRGEGHPHEAPASMAWPLRILAVGSIGAGWLSAFGYHGFPHWVSFDVEGVTREVIHEYAFSVPLAAISLAVAVIGIGVAAGYYFRNVGPHGLTRRSGAARAGYRFLEEKYFLDKIYINGVIRTIQYPIAKAMYWFDQHIIDGFVNGVAFVSRKVAGFVYDVVDQKVVDGAVNGAGFTAEESGGLLRYIQTGRVQQYAAVLFGAVGLFGLILVLTTT